MIRSKTFLILAICLAAMTSAVGYYLAAVPMGTIAVLIIGALWLPLNLHWQGWPASLGFLLLLSFNLIGAYLGVGTGWLLASVISGLAAWDLSHFLHRLSAVPRLEGGADIEGGHLTRLLLILAVGVLLSIVPLFTRLRLSFAWALLLSLLLLIGLGQTISFLRKQNQE